MTCGYAGKMEAYDIDNNDANDTIYLLTNRWILRGQIVAIVEGIGAATATATSVTGIINFGGRQQQHFEGIHPWIDDDLYTLNIAVDLLDKILLVNFQKVTR